MKRLNFVDASFVRLESNRTPMHVAALLLFRPREGAPRDFVRTLFEHLRSFPVTAEPFTLCLDGSLRSRLLSPAVKTPRDIDIDYHVRHSALAYPGNERQLGELIARLHSQRLVRSRPLWELHLIEGLENDRFAVYFKFHHALIDGMRGVKLVSEWLSENPAERNVPPPWAVPPKPRRAKSARRSSRSLLEPLRSAASVAGFVGRALRTATRGDEAAGVGAMLAAPSSELNCAITGQRRFATQSLPIDRLRAVAKAGDATVNDVALSLCGAVLRHHLEGRGALPGRPLVCMVPVGLELTDGSGGNALTFLVVPLGTDIDDDRARLQTVVKAMRQEKQRLQALARSAIDLYTQFIAIPVSVLQLTGIAERMSPFFNVVISNVRVPAPRLYLEGAPMTGVYPVSAVVAGQALNITLVGYADGLHFGFTACRDSVPSVQRLAVALPEELERLEHALGLPGPNDQPARQGDRDHAR